MTGDPARPLHAEGASSPPEDPSSTRPVPPSTEPSSTPAAPPSTEPSSTPAASPSAGRLAFVDRLRGLATLAMIEVHVVNALLAPAFRGGRAFAALDFVNGLVAPSFLVAAGLSLARSFAPGPPATPWPDAPSRRRLAAGHARRAAVLLALGYAMHASHVPAALSSPGPAAAQAWALFLQTDVLQLIALSLASLALVAALAGSARRYAAAALVAAIAAAWLGPLAHRHAWAPLPPPLATFFTERFGSPFPALPWAAFVALGAALGASGPPATDRRAWARRLVAVAAIGLALGALGALTPWPLGGSYERWTLSPSATALRAGLVCLVAAALSSASTRGRLRERPPAGVSERGRLRERPPAGVSERGRLRERPAAGLSELGRLRERLLALFGRHSLFVYVAHVVLVYGRHPLSLRSLIGPTLGPSACFVAWAAVSASMALGALALRAGRARLATRAGGPRALPRPTPRRAP